VLFLTSCEKEDETPNLNIQGRILDSSTGNGVAGASVQLSQKVLSGGTFSSIFQPVGTVSTNSNGNFAFEFPREAASEMRLVIERDNYFGKTIEINPDNVTIGSPYTTNVQIDPRAWLRWTLINQMPLSAQDLITFELLNANFACECCSNEQFSFTGMSVNETEKCQLVGNFMMRYRYTVIKDTLNQTIIDSVFCSSFDTTFVSIQY
jgi:hypothetical protein